ncbi:MAG TPA: methyltransferase domain-containing protein [Lysobacter sp.]
MERLAFGEGSHYSALEASIHLCRYLTAKSFCAGKRVLDIACGEGYGSALMSGWGATSVLGLDVSEHAIARARTNFSKPNVRFSTASGEGLRDVVGDATFDLIVSLETIEHVDDPALFLRNLKSLLADGGVIVLSCPNDHWYFADGGSNPYHKHRWTAEEFKRFSEDILGPASWAYGTFGLGFATYAEKGSLRVLGTDTPQEAMVDSAPADTALLAHMQADSAPSPHDVSYFVGVWGATPPDAVFAGYPVSMDLTRTIRFSRDEANAAARWAQGIQGELATKQSTVDALVQGQRELQALLAQKQDLVDVLSARAGDADVVHGAAEGAADAMASRVRRLEDELVVIERQKRQQVMLYRVAQAEAEALRGQLGHHQYLTSVYSAEIAGLRASEAGLQARLSMADVQLANANTHLAETKEQLAKIQDLLAGAHEQLGAVPWRVVAVWRRVRRFIPTWILEGALRGARLMRGGGGR